MKLHSLRIEGLRRIQSATVYFGEATFLIGRNNVGKSTIFRAIDLLLSAKKTVPGQEYYSVIDAETGETKPACTVISIEAEFRNLPPEALQWRGFKGRIFSYEKKSENDTGLSISYRKTFEIGKDVVIELKSLERAIKPEFAGCKTPQDYISAGADPENVQELFTDLATALNAKGREKLEQLDCIWEVGNQETWFKNPGGIPGVVLKMLPRLLLIPADTSAGELEGASSGVLGQTLSELFADVRESSGNYAKAQEHLDLLAKELDPQDESSEFGKMIAELNAILAGVFPDSQLHAKASLSNPDTALKPTFNVEMSSNVRTPVAHQGAGMIRAAAFGMLRFRQKWLSKREDQHPRSLIVCFEEPEIYLHPSAANQMRNTIYELSGDDSQIVATTHSPYIIDLSRKPRQVLNCLCVEDGVITARPFNVTDAFQSLEGDAKAHVKMLLRMDDYAARAFFANNVVIVEGDTEELVIRESLKRLSKEKYLNIVSNFEIIKARGKASIIGLTKYLVAMGIKPIVVHDRDAGVPGAEAFNLPIADSAAGGRVVQMFECIEDEIGYATPSAEKPYRAFQETAKWGETWADLPERWRNKMHEIFGTHVQDV